MGNYDHIQAGFTLGFQHRRALADLLSSTPDNCCILELDPGKLKSSGIQALALDFDGVLSPHGLPVPLAEARQWLDRCAAVFGHDKIFILSNKPTEERRNWFNRHFSGMRFISQVRKKPYPDGLHEIMKLANVPISTILMVDDRLLTGCLAAVNAGAQPCYIRNPYISYNSHPVSELFFLLLRSIERSYIKICSIF